MNNMDGNPHFGYGLNAGYQTIDAYGQAQATLALAYEQRTANLIALAELKRKDRASGSTAASTEAIMIIEERLGLS